MFLYGTGYERQIWILLIVIFRDPGNAEDYGHQGPNLGGQSCRYHVFLIQLVRPDVIQGL